MNTSVPCSHECGCWDKRSRTTATPRSLPLYLIPKHEHSRTSHPNCSARKCSAAARLCDPIPEASKEEEEEEEEESHRYEERVPCPHSCGCYNRVDQDEKFVVHREVSASYVAKHRKIDACHPRCDESCAFGVRQAAERAARLAAPLAPPASAVMTPNRTTQMMSALSLIGAQERRDTTLETMHAAAFGREANKDPAPSSAPVTAPGFTITNGRVVYASSETPRSSLVEQYLVACTAALAGRMPSPTSALGPSQGAARLNGAASTLESRPAAAAASSMPVRSTVPAAAAATTTASSAHVSLTTVPVVDDNRKSVIAAEKAATCKDAAPISSNTEAQIRAADAGAPRTFENALWTRQLFHDAASSARTSRERPVDTPATPPAQASASLASRKRTAEEPVPDAPEPKKVKAFRFAAMPAHLSEEAQRLFFDHQGHLLAGLPWSVAGVPNGMPPLAMRAFYEYHARRLAPTEMDVDVASAEFRFTDMPADLSDAAQILFYDHQGHLMEEQPWSVAHMPRVMPPLAVRAFYEYHAQRLAAK